MRNHHLKVTFSLFATLLLAGLAFGDAQARSRKSPSSMFLGNDNDFEIDEEVQAEYQAREAAAEANFDAIMVPQNAMPPKASPVQRALRRQSGNMGNIGNVYGGSGYAASDAPATASIIQGLAQPVEAPEVELPLSAYAELRKQLQTIREEAARQMGPAVVLGAAEYTGEALPGALRLDLALQVTLGREGLWKTVPLAGDGVVLAKATVDGKPVPVSRRNGYHVWVTQGTGEVNVNVELLVPQRGPRGSIEFDFLVARTPVTRFSCFFPVAGLEPRINAAVRSESKPHQGGTLVTATLRPTARIHLLGLKDLGEQEGQKAKVYAESLNLLSVDEGALELFAVFRYTILYAGTKQFDILLPKGMEVVSADGMGAFRFSKQAVDGGTLLKGETAFPIRNKYEISLRLRRELTKKGEAFAAPLPRCQGVERESGWLAVEVPGKLQLAEKKRAQVSEVDVRQLPAEMVSSAVSPILKAYRYHTPDAQVQLVATRLPEIEPKSASIDRIRAFTKLTQEGKLITDMRITLRNRLRPDLRLSLPEGTRVSSALLDGQPFNPSKDDDGRILLPLKRSGGGDRLRPFTVSVVVESQLDPLGWFGEPELTLPSLDLPVSSLVWTVYLPARNLYSRLEGEIESQTYVGRASWHQPVYRPRNRAPVAGGGFSAATASGRSSVTADAGAMPVRFKIPTEGLQLSYQRYWIDADHAVEVEFHYLRSWLRYPAWMGLSLLAALGLLLFSLRFGPSRSKLLSSLGLALFVAAAWGGQRVEGVEAIALALLLGVIAICVQRRWIRRLPEALTDWAKTLFPRFREREKHPELWRGWPLFRRISATVGLCFFGLLLLEASIHFLFLLFNPLP